MMLTRQSLAAVVLACTIAAPGVAAAQAVRNTSSGFTLSTLPANDDGSTGLVPLGFNVNFFGVTGNQVYVNNNGNVTFDAALGTYTPFGLSGTARKIIAPFFADVDTRGSGSHQVMYGTGTVNGMNAFVVNWDTVGYYGSHTDKLNVFQLVMIDRHDTGAGNFDFEFNYNQIQWETGDASGGAHGLGGSCARAGYSNGLSGPSNVSFEMAGSAQCGAFLDGGPDALKSHSLNSDVAGRYVFMVRNGTVVNTAPEPSSLALLGSGLFGLVPMIRRRRR